MFEKGRHLHDELGELLVDEGTTDKFQRLEGLILVEVDVAKVIYFLVRLRVVELLAFLK